MTSIRPRSEAGRAPRRERRMTLTQHLREFRRRLLISALGLVVAMAIAFVITGPVIDLMSEPIRVIAEQRGQDFASLNFPAVTSGFNLRMRIAFALGILLSAPIWLWQAWAFTVPALTGKEIRYTVGFVGAAIPLFFGGAAVGWLVMPHVVEVMASFVPEQGAQFYDAAYYYDFVFKFVLVLGVAFVLPVFLVALNFTGIAPGRAILRSWRYAVIAATAFAAVATPAADVMSMIMLGGILIVLYVGAALVSVLFDLRRARRAARLLESVA